MEKEKIEKMAEIIGDVKKAKEIYEALMSELYSENTDMNLEKKFLKITQEHGIVGLKAEKVVNEFFDMEFTPIEEIIPNIRKYEGILEDHMYTSIYILLSKSRIEYSICRKPEIEKELQPPQGMYRGGAESQSFQRETYLGESYSPETEERIKAEVSPIRERMMKGELSMEKGFSEMLKVVNSELSKNMVAAAASNRRFERSMVAPLVEMLRDRIEKGYKADALMIIENTFDFFKEKAEEKMKALENPTENLSKDIEELNDYLSAIEVVLSEAEEALKKKKP